MLFLVLVLQNCNIFEEKRIMLLLVLVLVKLMLHISRVPCFSGIVFTQLANLFTLVTGIPWLLLALAMTLQKQRRLIFLPVCNLFSGFACGVPQACLRATDVTAGGERVMGLPSPTLEEDPITRPTK